MNTLETMREEEKTQTAAVINGIRYTVHDFRAITDAMFDTSDWKAPFRAAEFFHARRPSIVGIQAITGYVIIESEGYVY